ncbi:nuclear transport factor 2 family protein [Sphingomonas sp. MG17]|uniref:Nuclear transport factor 2 family protein n=1 Tax=Sphingomonas tagetis TaxID=2949092 RepID=A0A9X2HKC5_9SPHN|nr:nuclear transport factor 2 family protein [Sphingomonas tagetis]MCP3732488.1 nuclear transport factor 2 family protein [Sphingomonas tagetis]
MRQDDGLYMMDARRQPSRSALIDHHEERGMTCVSMVDHQTRVEIHEVLARFCHYIDDREPRNWASLFTPDGALICEGQDCARGKEQLAEAAARIQREGSATARHVITSVMIEPGHSRREVVVRASGLVIDMGHGGLSEFHDYRFTLRQAGAWRIAQLAARRVGAETALPCGIFQGVSLSTAEIAHAKQPAGSHAFQ